MIFGSGTAESDNNDNDYWTCRDCKRIALRVLWHDSGYFGRL